MNSQDFNFALSIGPLLHGVFVPHEIEEVVDRLGLTSSEELGFRYRVVNDGAEATIEVEGGPAGDVDHAITLVLACAKRFALNGMFAFSWCDRGRRLGGSAFGGGACVINLSSYEVFHRIDARDWMEQTLRVARIPSFKEIVGKMRAFRDKWQGALAGC